MTRLVRLSGGERWQLADVEFECSRGTDSTTGHFALCKPPELVEKYVELCHRFEGANIVELGIKAGGSTALLGMLAQPRKLVSIELNEPRVAALDELLVSKQLGQSVHPYYGVDQSDRERLTAIVDDEFGDTPLDLVVDDASHLHKETVASFDVLYPRLRPGGLFIIEDWAAHQVPVFWIRATLAQGDVVSDVRVDRYWITITRGPADLDRDTFHLADARTGDWEWVLP